MPEDEYSRMPLVAKLICDHISLDGIDRYLAETGVQESDFVLVEPEGFAGEIFAVDGSNASLCSWSTANVNLIRAGYAVYRGRDWRRTVITFDDVFLADPRLFKDMFDPYLEQFFGLKGIDLKESDLDRLSSYYREMQEYVAIDEAIREARGGDIILYDGSFDVFEPLRGVLAAIFARAQGERGLPSGRGQVQLPLLGRGDISALCAAYRHGRQPAPAGRSLVSKPEGQKSGCGPAADGTARPMSSDFAGSPGMRSGWMLRPIWQAISAPSWESWLPTPVQRSARAIPMPSSGRTGISGSRRWKGRQHAANL